MTILVTLKPWIRECQELVCPDNQIILDDGTVIPFVIVFPKALVRWQSWGEWLVDEVAAKGTTQDGRMPQRKIAVQPGGCFAVR